MNRLAMGFCIAIAIAAVVPRGAAAQTFDVATVRPQPEGDRGFFVRPPSNGRFTATGATAKLLLMLAYGIQETQVVGGPSWLDTAKWNIEAKTDDGAQHSTDDTRRMLQHLLVERFGLQIHRETARRPVYALTVAKNGPKFAVSSRERTNVRVTGKSIDIQRGSITAMIQVLGSALDRPVVDRTGLSELYDLSVEWDDAPTPQGGAFVVDSPATPTSDRGSIFSAIQDQLGLRLEPQQAPVEVIVIDRMETPSPN